MKPHPAHSSASYACRHTPLGATTLVPEPADRLPDDQTELGSLLGPFAQEIRNPLSALMAASEILSEDIEPNHPCRGYARLIHDIGSRLHSTVSDLMALALPAHAAPRSLNLGRIVEERLRHALRAADRNGVECVSAIAPDRLRLMADRAALELALDRLFDHQIAVMEKGGVLTVAVDKLPQGCLRFLSSDSGPEIPDDLLTHVFDPFFATDGRHAGLSLALFKRMVEEFGGKVMAWKNYEKGLTVEARLPVA